MSVLTVFLAAPGPADGVRDVLTDLSSAGLLDPFLWIDERDVTSGLPGVRATSVDGGEVSTVALQNVLASTRVTRVRLCVLVPFIEGLSRFASNPNARLRICSSQIRVVHSWSGSGRS